MDEERNLMAETTDTTPEPISDAIPTPTPRQRKPRTTTKTKQINRAAEDCYTTDPRKMTDTERIAVIKLYQDNMRALYDQFEDYKRATEGAFEQARTLRDENNRIKIEARAKINLFKQNINLLYQNAMLVTMED